MKKVYHMSITAILICLTLSLGVLTSCRAAVTENTAVHMETGEESMVPADTRETGRSADAVQESGKGDSGHKEGPVMVDQWQMVPGYGICGKGQPAMYVMDSDAGRSRVDGKDVSAQLLSAVYQDNVLSVKVLLKDYSVTIIPEGEVQELLAKEKENEEKQNQGKAVEWDNSYICIDSERQIYGRSAYRNSLRENAMFHDRRVYGAGIADVGFTFNRTSSSRRFTESGRRPYLSEVSESIISDKQFLIREPEGTYKLFMEGFEEPFELVLERAPVYDSLEEIEGIVGHEGFYGKADGGTEKEGFRLWTCTYAGDGYSISFRRGKLMYTFSDGKTEEAIPLPGTQTTSDVRELSGIGPRSTQETMYRIPEGALVTEASLQAEQPVITSREFSEVLEIPVPQEDEPLEKMIEFKDCRIYLTGINRLDELYEYGRDAENNPVMKHMVYIKARAEMKDEDQNLCYVNGVQPGAGEDTPEHPYNRIYAHMDIRGADQDNTGELAGIRAFYDEGDSVIRLQLSNPVYWWNQEFVLPVQM